MGTQEEINLPTRSACSRISDVLFSRIKFEGKSVLKLMHEVDFSLFKKNLSTNLERQSVVCLFPPRSTF